MELNCLAIKRHEVRSPSLSDCYIASKLVSREKHDKKYKIIAFFRKVASDKAFLEQNWLGVSYWAD